ncbi:hypothetical protein ACLESO_25860 [Pyxidicoccus sp. 3LG]
MIRPDAGWKILVGIMLMGVGAESFAAGGACPTTPRSYDTAPCNNSCIRDAASNTMRCDITASAGDNEVTVVTNYGNAIPIAYSRYSAWGTANGVDFCCALDSTAGSPLDAVEVLTGAGRDIIRFTALNGSGIERNLTSNQHQTAANGFVGYARPGDDYDRVYGSNSAASDYMDHLTGERGPDLIMGNNGNDYISVAETRSGAYSTGNDGEGVFGEKGRDEIVGATNDINATDTILVAGGDQNDLLCTGNLGSLTGQKVTFFGGNGDDEIYSMSSSVAFNDGRIYGDAGSNGCDNPGGGTETNCSRSYNGSNFTAWSPMECPP